MYGGLFGYLPSTTKTKSSDKETTVDVDAPLPEQDSRSSQLQEKDTDDNNASTSSKKRPASVISSLGSAGTSMAFVPSALRNRNRKRNNSVGAVSLVAGASVARIPPAPSSVITRSGVAEPASKTTRPSDESTTTTVSHIHGNPTQEAPFLEDESEAMRQLHASVVDVYDPHVPNDLLVYWDRKAMEKQRIELEREAQETLQRQEHLRQQLEQERESLAKSGNFGDIVQHYTQTSMGLGRGRGVSNLPAWLVQKQRVGLGSSETSRRPSCHCTVILSNLTLPGDVDDDVEVEVKEECEEQCGPVINVTTKDAKPPLQPLVQVHVEFENKADADKAVQIFHGRKFGSRRIIAELMKEM
jgi:splicing factor 45